MKKILSLTLAVQILFLCIIFSCQNIYASLHTLENKMCSEQFFWDKAGEDADNGYKAYEVEYGAPLIIPEKPYREGSKFLGWNDWYTDETVELENETMNSLDGRKFYAVWGKDIYSITYYVDSLQYKTDYYFFGQEVNIPSAPGKEGYTFTGWSWKMGMLTVVIDEPQTMPSANLTAYAIYEPTIYKATFYCDGKVWTKINNIYGESFIMPRLPEKEGYTFDGWSPKPPQTTPAYDTQFNAVFVPNKYVASFIVDSEIYKQVTYTYGQKSVALPPIPPKDGYDAQWENYSLVIGGVEINAIYTPKYKLNSVYVEDFSMNYKDSHLIKPFVDASEGMTYKVSFESSDSKIVSVDENGMVTANSRGTAKIYCTVTDMYGNKTTDFCTVTVKYNIWQWIIVLFALGWIWYR